MLFSNFKVDIKSKKGHTNEYRFIEVGNSFEKTVMFLACSLKKYETINKGFHNRISIGFSKAQNPKIVYSPDDKDLYLLLKGEANECIEYAAIPEEPFKEVSSVVYSDGDDKYQAAIVKAPKNGIVIFKNEYGNPIRYINIKNNFVKESDQPFDDIEITC